MLERKKTESIQGSPALCLAQPFREAGKKSTEENVAQGALTSLLKGIFMSSVNPFLS
jgi:hypothetical protein